MKEPINKKVVLTLLLGSIVFVIITLSSVAYLIGKDVSNQDTSAAVETASAFDDGDYSLKECAINKGMAYCVPKYAFANQKSSLIVSYFPSGFRDGNPPQTPEWEITICKKKYTSTENFKEYTFRFPTKTCAITIKLLPGTELETVFSKEYTILSNIKNFKMSEPTYLKEIGVDYDATPIQGDISADLAKKGITESMIEDVVWEYKYTSDYCSADVASNFSTKTKYSGFIRPVAVGKCRVKLTAFVVTCTDCATTNRVVYTASSILTTKVLEEGIMPSPTGYWGGSPTVTPTNPVYITPTTRVTGTPTPTTVITPTPVIYPTTSAVSLYPSIGNLQANTQKEVWISFNQPVNNVSALQVRLAIKGGTIVPDSFVSAGMVIGTCDTAGHAITTDRICFDFVKGAGYLTAGELGSFKILPSSGNEDVAVISTDVGNAYVAGGNTVYSQTQTLAVYQK